MQREREDEREPAFFEMGEKGGEENEGEKLELATFEVEMSDWDDWGDWYWTHLD